MIGPRGKREWAAQLLHQTGCERVFRLAPTWRGVLVLNYHRIGVATHQLGDHALWSATPEDFERQLGWLQKHFDIITLDDLERIWPVKSGRYVLLTFDDGYLDNYTEAYRILRQRRVPAVFFVTTGFIDHARVPWWDEIAWMVRHSRLEELPALAWTGMPISLVAGWRERAIQRLLGLYKRLPGDRAEVFLNDLAEALQTGRCPVDWGQELWMTWPMLREMQQAGMEIGAHTVTHPVLSRLPLEQQEDEIQQSRQRIEQQLGRRVRAFSYPVGGRASFTHETEQLLQKHGFDWGFTFEGGLIRPRHENRWALPRTAVEQDVDEAHFQAMLCLPQWFS
ncbi:MAG: polysaccharide deacetylase [Planctomycetaceae bacterium]|nr:MAG: polysaccharide deacetylase [Planctomycetaceae bacterium]